MTMYHRQVLRPLLAGAFMLLMFLPTAGKAAGPDTVVDAFHVDLLSVMKNSKNLGVSGRYEQFLLQIDRYFHMPLMVSFVSGKHWTTSTKDARIKLVSAARRLSAGELAVLFSGYGGETFNTLKTRPINDGTVLVETELERKNDSNVKVTYRLRKFGENWRIIDVLLDGTISQLLKRRDEYLRTLEDHGIAGLVDLLNAKADEILRSDTASKSAN